MLASLRVIHLVSFRLICFQRVTVSAPEHSQVTLLSPCESLVVPLFYTKQLFQRSSHCFTVENGVGNSRSGSQIYLKIKEIFATVKIFSLPSSIHFLLLSFHQLTELEPVRACKLSLFSGSMANFSCLDFKYLRWKYLKYSTLSP